MGEKIVGISEPERKKPMSKRIAMAIIAGEVLSMMSGPYDNGPMPIIDFEIPEKRDIRAEKGSKGNFERVRENKYTKKIRGRSRN